MENAIREIIDGIVRDCIFDSHYVISQLLKNHSDVFYEFIRRMGNADTPATHGHLAKIIGICGAMKLGDRYLELNEIKSWSENIHGKSSPCTAWIKR